MATENHELQKITEGYGPAYHRVYEIKFPATYPAARDAMRDLQTDFNRCSPQILAHFEKTCGTGEALKSGDEFNIHISGPWNGPVRVSEVAEDRIGMVTLDGHLEAGEIHFRILPVADDEVKFEIESIARSRNMIIDFVYDKVPIAKMMQTQMWTSFCKSFAEMAMDKAGTAEMKDRMSDVEILTERRAEDTGKWETL